MNTLSLLLRMAAVAAAIVAVACYASIGTKVDDLRAALAAKEERLLRAEADRDAARAEIAGLAAARERAVADLAEKEGEAAKLYRENVALREEGRVTGRRAQLAEEENRQLAARHRALENELINERRRLEPIINEADLAKLRQEVTDLRSINDDLKQRLIHLTAVPLPAPSPPPDVILGHAEAERPATSNPARVRGVSPDGKIVTFDFGSARGARRGALLYVLDGRRLVAKVVLTEVGENSSFAKVLPSEGRGGRLWPRQDVTLVKKPPE